MRSLRTVYRIVCRRRLRTEAIRSPGSSCPLSEVLKFLKYRWPTFCTVFRLAKTFGALIQRDHFTSHLKVSVIARSLPSQYETRHRASTSMYSLTFCVRFLLPERHQRKPAVQAAAVMLRTPPVDGQSPASQPRPLPIYGAQF